MLFYSEIISKSFNSKNVPNLLLYGHQSINKLNILKEILNLNYKITEEKVIKEKNLEIIKTEIYYLFNLALITSKNYQQFLRSIIYLMKQLLKSLEQIGNACAIALRQEHKLTTTITR